MRGFFMTASVALLAGTTLGGPVDQAPGAWLYPECSFQDGRDRATDGTVGELVLNGMRETGDPEDAGPYAACFMEGSNPTPEQWAQLDAALAGGYISRYNVGGRWTGSPGSPIDLTWSFVPDGLSIADGGLGGTQNSVLFARLDSQYGAANRATWIAQFTAVFARWQALSGINYTRVQVGGNPWDDGASWGSGSSAGLRGQIRICMKNSLDGGGGVLAYNSFPQNGDMVLDGADSWSGGAPSYRFFRNTIAHEHGHGLGFNHVCPIANTKLMEPFLSTAFDGPQQDEVRAVHHNYGDPLEGNNTAPTATILGTLAAGSTTTVGAIPAPAIGGASNLSLHPTGDSDYFRINLAVPRLVNITLTPVGTTYTDLDQNANGSCQTTPTNNTNALAQANLSISAYTSSGTTLLRTKDTAAAGAAEVLTGILLNEGDSYVRAHSAASIPGTQCYSMSIVVQSASLTCNASDGAFPDKVLITWPAVPEATLYRVMRSTTNDNGTASSLGDVTPPTLAFDDTTAVPGTTYYYWIRAQQTGSTLFRYMSNIGSPGFRGVANAAPTADAGDDQLVNDLDGNLSEGVTLDGSGSIDTDGTITNYLWQEGAITLANGPSATAPVVLSAGQHTVQLTVTDNGGATGIDFVVITVNRLPVADAGADTTVTDSDLSGSEVVNLDGSGSSDPDGSITNYLWQEGAATLADGPSPTAPVSFAVGTHVVTLTVTDNRGVTDTDTLTVIVEEGTPPSCDPDFNEDGNVDQDDVACLINIVAGNPGCSVLDPDFNGDGNIDQDDVAALINVVAGGPCP